MKKTEMLIKKDEENSDIALPRYMSEAAAGMDVCAAVKEDVVIAPSEVKLIPTGLYTAVPVGYEIQVRPRSGLALKNGIIVVNSPGTIDADYRGEVGIILGNISKDPFTVIRGMRIAQLVVKEVVQAEIKEVNVLPDSDRGTGGFGSSGLH
ncbi:MAG: dUTP diphosphatase [Planctomycetota bacterium]|jgi:dUTP pyrophosphatase